MIEIISKVQIHKGWSEDQKYCAADKTGNKYLLRTSPEYTYNRKLNEFELMKKISSLGIPMCIPLEFGIKDQTVYSLQSWIDGYDAEEVMQSFTEKEQYSYGLTAGRALKEIHKIPAPQGTESWESFFSRKIDRKIKQYEECPIKYENGNIFKDFINSHRHLLKNRPSCFQHGDYHIGNMMIGKDKKLYIIDFNRYDYGDPWEEFNRIVWSAQASPEFASGIINGYFGGNIPDEFWYLLALYISSNTLGSLPWCLPYGEKEINTMDNQAKEVLCWYNNLKNIVPNWYIKDR